ncbi:MAG: hypothetical protein DRP90_03110 [Planctomycetota bacterium]|nr:MAG: hypothetical protein DRP90_03110 [Planctomycetota bacterium]
MKKNSEPLTPKAFQPCKARGCNKPAVRDGLCEKHAREMELYSQIISDIGRKDKELCKVPGCNNPRHARGYCNTHYGQLWRSGKISPELRPRRRSRRSRKDDSAIRIPKELERLNMQLAKARELYNSVVGFESRLKWRREIRHLENEIEKVKAELKPFEIEEKSPLSSQDKQI